MEDPGLGHQLRVLRTAAGRTVASVAVDAGLSVPYIANLENGRGNPTLFALGRLASALGMKLSVSLVPADAGLAQADGRVPARHRGYGPGAGPGARGLHDPPDGRPGHAGRRPGHRAQ